MPELRRYGLREKTRVWKSGPSAAETRTRSVFGVYMAYRDLVMAALSCWWLICDFQSPIPVAIPVPGGAIQQPYTDSLGMKAADKLSPLTPQPSSMGQVAVGWALGVILCWSPGARFNETPRR